MSGISITRIDALDCVVGPYEWPFARDEAARIEDHWRGLVRERPRMYDGRVLLQHHTEFVASEGHRVLHARCFETSFSSFIAWRDFGFPDKSVRNLFAMAALRAQDGFVLGEMGAHTANAGRVYFPAGTPDPGDVQAGRLDLMGSVIRELSEETGLEAHEVHFDPDWLVVEAGSRLGCMKMTRVDLPAADLAADLNARIARQTDPELARMHVVRSAADLDPQRMPEFIIAFLEAMFSGQAG